MAIVVMRFEITDDIKDSLAAHLGQTRVTLAEVRQEIEDAVSDNWDRMQDFLCDDDDDDEEEEKVPAHSKCEDCGEKGLDDRGVDDYDGVGLCDSCFEQRHPTEGKRK